MKLLILVFLFLLCVIGCGTSASSNELIGQVKKVVRKTPIICPDYDEVDISLGVMRNGVGSLSREDVALFVADAKSVSVLRGAAENGRLVKATYDVQRVGICRPDHWLTSAELIDDVAPEKAR
jgi:hypothetical protein